LRQACLKFNTWR